ncbi:PTS glucose transporter subunit IIA [Oenococcus sp. UCMA 17063]|nr:PTS glucose transporter subunit IIA [Oenococcus sp. UCMA 17063]
MIHIGIDTVKLNGKNFTPYVEQGDIVTKIYKEDITTTRAKKRII